jgi:hypothetical protein
MKEESKNETLELIDVREEIIKDLNVEVARLKQQVMDKECEMMQMEKYFKHAYMIIVLEGMIGMSIIAIVCTYLLTTK